MCYNLLAAGSYCKGSRAQCAAYIPAPRFTVINSDCLAFAIRVSNSYFICHMSPMKDLFLYPFPTLVPVPLPVSTIGLIVHPTN